MDGRYYGTPENPETAANRVAKERFRAGSGPNTSCSICGSQLKPNMKRFADDEIQLGYKDCECDGFKLAYKEIFEQETARYNAEITKINRERLDDMISYSGLGRRFAERTFETFRAETEWQKTAVTVAQEFCQSVIDRTDNGQGLLLSGSVGTGKTHLAAAASIRLMESDVQVLYGTAAGILADIKKSWADDSDDDVIKRLCRARVLVIDDLGKEYSKKTDGWSWAQEQFFRVINARYENYMPLVITTNFDIRKLTEAMGDAIVSRIIECCRGVRCDGADYRMKKWEK